MTDYQYKRTYNPNRKGPKDSCEKGHSYHVVKRRSWDVDQGRFQVRVYCPCYHPKGNDIVFYHNLDQAVLQHTLIIRALRPKEEQGNLSENLFSDV